MEHDPTGRVAHEHGAKLDAEKAPMYRGVLQYFPRALKAVSEVSAYGANKYTWGGWRTVPLGVERYSDACIRHLEQEAEGEERDRDTQLLHAAHTAWNALARLELMLARFTPTDAMIDAVADEIEHQVREYAMNCQSEWRRGGIRLSGGNGEGI